MKKVNMQSIKELYPEAFEKPEYSIQELLKKTTINRKSFDRYKKRFPKYYLDNSRKEKPNNKMFFTPFIYIICLEISKKQKEGLKNKEIESYLSDNILLEPLRKAENRNSKTLYKNKENDYKQKEISFSENEENARGKRENVSLSDFLNIKDELHKRDVELAKKNGDLQVLEEKIKGMKIHIGLLEAPIPKKIEPSLNKKDFILYTFSFTFLCVFIWFAWMFQNSQIDLAKFF